ncbi:MAG TPA: BsaWI family type II restriction enzyme [Chitinophagales bacterium]|nr:BsaWI family type II restriction enzyme [Chitinophagales bacterium]
MKAQDLIQLYELKKQQYGNKAYQHLSTLLNEAKEEHKTYFLNSEGAQKSIEQGKQPDHEQSWRAFKGKSLEKLIEHIIKEAVEQMGLKIINGNTLEKTQGKSLSDELSNIKRKLLIDYGINGCHLPDVDLIIYEPMQETVIAVLSSKVTLRERVAQTGYWKLKLLESNITKKIKVFFITLDEDGTLTTQKPTKKGRAIVETDTDGCYVLTENYIEESDHVKTFGKFIPDLQKIIKKNNPK